MASQGVPNDHVALNSYAHHHFYSPPDLGPYLPVWDSHELLPNPLPIAIFSKISRRWELDSTRSRAASFNIQPATSGGV
ncbi:hypothetical protein ETB97_000200 [Aspergillus alliaceus]|uniref:Uncharacterized protein n=1 Tax=Petromyces alliaceus TaxID=209559 RepID=A0A8H6EB96_PETAA|nr:hypothetical protein ETB97_000200 [Aspergillus burnettii]